VSRYDAFITTQGFPRIDRKQRKTGLEVLATIRMTARNLMR
jgi:hypothetical protein